MIQLLQIHGLFILDVTVGVVLGTTIYNSIAQRLRESQSKP